jgi:hypothetical protein
MSRFFKKSARRGRAFSHHCVFIQPAWGGCRIQERRSGRAASDSGLRGDSSVRPMGAQRPGRGAWLSASVVGIWAAGPSPSGPKAYGISPPRVRRMEPNPVRASRRTARTSANLVAPCAPLALPLDALRAGSRCPVVAGKSRASPQLLVTPPSDTRLDRRRAPGALWVVLLSRSGGRILERFRAATRIARALGLVATDPSARTLTQI